MTIKKLIEDSLNIILMLFFTLFLISGLAILGIIVLALLSFILSSPSFITEVMVVKALASCALFGIMFLVTMVLSKIAEEL